MDLRFPLAIRALRRTTNPRLNTIEYCTIWKEKICVGSGISYAMYSTFKNGNVSSVVTLSPQSNEYWPKSGCNMLDILSRDGEGGCAGVCERVDIM